MNREEKQSQLSFIWDSINETSIAYLNEEFEVIAPKLIEFLIVSILMENEISIGTYKERNVTGSSITYDTFYTDKQLNLKLSNNLKFELELILTDFDCELKTYKYPLTEVDEAIIPEGFKKIMSDVAKNQKEKTILIKSIR